MKRISAEHLGLIAGQKQRRKLRIVMAQRLFSAVEVASQAPPVLPRHGTPGGRLHRRFAHLLPYHRDEFVGLPAAFFLGQQVPIALYVDSAGVRPIAAGVDASCGTAAPRPPIFDRSTSFCSSTACRFSGSRTSCRPCCRLYPGSAPRS